MALKKEYSIIGSGFSGLAAAAVLAKKGASVKVFEKNEQLGGRARQFEANGFTFDMGPSWYWMPEVFEDFYQKFGHTASDFYDLVQLSPSYQIIYKDFDAVTIPSEIGDLYELFESYEKGSAEKLKYFLAEAKYKYEVGMNEFVWKPSLSIKEFFDFRILKSGLKLQMFSSVSKQIRSLFSNPKLIQLLEFPVLFLGEKPQNTPALYSLMNYADLVLGTWYPMGGMHKIIEAMTTICKEQGVEFYTNTSVKKILSENNKCIGLETEKGEVRSDCVLSSADYHHTDTQLLESDKSNYSEKYWDKRKLAPSSLLFYVGVDKKLPNLKHHNLFFIEDFDNHAHQIYTEPDWPDKPLFYVCCPSKTDSSVAPEGKENMFILVPIAPDLKEDESKKLHYYNDILSKLETFCGTSIKEHILYKKEFSVADFKSEYNAFKGNAYGLANTLMQTAFLKPRIRNKKLNNLFYTGQLTVPGPGVPPSIISGQMVGEYAWIKMGEE